MTKKEKKKRNRIIVTFIAFVVLLFLQHAGVMERFPRLLQFVFYFIPYVYIGYDVIKRAGRNIAHGQVFDENFLMMIATLAAFFIGENLEALAVMLFYQIGELFEDYAVGQSRKSITDMMNIAPEYANLLVDGQLQQVDPEEVMIGDVIVVKPGEKIPLDGVVIEGESYLDTAALTGEAVPRRVTVKDVIISGCVNGQNTLKVRVTKRYEDSTVAKILELVENASSKKARAENFITRFAKYYTPVVTISAVALAVIPPLFLGGAWFDWIERACIFLIVSCPCALVLSVPLGFFAGIGAASKIGVLVKGSNYLEAMSQVQTLLFDKTGTLTHGDFNVSTLIPGKSVEEDRLLELAAYAEMQSNHPIALSIEDYYREKELLALDESRVTDIKEKAGYGMIGLFDEKELLAGNVKLMEQNHIPIKEYDGIGTVVYIAYDGNYQGAIVIADSMKNGVKEALSELHRAGVSRLVMLTGDRAQAAEKVAAEIGVDEVYSELLPDDKVTKLELFLQNAVASASKKKVGFVGDGMNDAPVLMRADVGIAMGSLGSDAAIEAADIVLMDDDISKIPRIVKIAKKTMNIVRSNIIFAIAVKIAVLILGAVGLATMWEAVFADVGVCVVAILNSMRALKESK